MSVVKIVFTEGESVKLTAYPVNGYKPWDKAEGEYGEAVQSGDLSYRVAIKSHPKAGSLPISAEHLFDLASLCCDEAELEALGDWMDEVHALAAEGSIFTWCQKHSFQHFAPKPKASKKGKPKASKKGKKAKPSGASSSGKATNAIDQLSKKLEALMEEVANLKA